MFSYFGMYPPLLIKNTESDGNFRNASVSSPDVNNHICLMPERLAYSKRRNFWGIIEVLNFINFKHARFFAPYSGAVLLGSDLTPFRCSKSTHNWLSSQKATMNLEFTENSQSDTFLLAYFSWLTMNFFWWFKLEFWHMCTLNVVSCDSIRTFHYRYPPHLYPSSFSEFKILWNQGRSC